MALDRSTQPLVKSADNVLVGVAQVRAGKISSRASSAASYDSAFFAVGKSTWESAGFSINKTSGGTAVMSVVRPTIAGGKVVKNTATANTLALTGTYTGNFDGQVIIQVIDGTNVRVVAPNGYAASVATTTLGTGHAIKLDSVITSGLTVTGAITGLDVDDTFTCNVYADSATFMNQQQTGIITPFSMLSSVDSVGGLKAAGFSAKINGVKKLEVGFPSVTVDQILESTSVSANFESYEYTNAVLANVKLLINEIINKGNIAAIPLELIMRTKGGDLVSFWIPSASLTALPELAPGNDYSTSKFDFEALKQTEVTPSVAADQYDYYNGALTYMNIYVERMYSRTSTNSAYADR